MKQKITFAAFMLFLLSAAVFSVFGDYIRLTLSVDVIYIYPEIMHNDGTVKGVPFSAVWTDDQENTFVWIIISSEEQNSLYTVEACPIMPVGKEDGLVLFRDWIPKISDAVAISWESKLRDGVGVKPKKQSNIRNMSKFINCSGAKEVWEDQELTVSAMPSHDYVSIINYNNGKKLVLMKHMSSVLSIG